MWVSDYYKTATSVSDLSVKLHYFDLGEGSFIKDEVMLVFCIFNIHPKNINREPGACKVSRAINQ